MIVLDLARFAVDQRVHPLPDRVYHAATRALVDWYGATVAGAGMPPAVILRRALVVGEGHGRSRLVPDGQATDVRTAALVNATASHVAELDDIFRDGAYHPGSPTVGAALAVAEDRGLPGEALLRGIAVGYEIGARVAAAVQPAHYEYWHTTGTVGTIGAAAAVAELLQLDSEPFAHALATATTTAAGLQQAFRSDAMSKPLHAGHAAEAGLVAALAAAEGFTGALDILEGEAGFGVAMSRAPAWEEAVASLGRPWAVELATVKNHSCCGHTFAAVDAVLEHRADGIRHTEVESIVVETYATAVTVAGYTDPSSAFEAKFSLPYCVAAALVTGSVRLSAFTPERLADPALRALMDRVEVRSSDELGADFPKRRRARVTVRLHDGSTRSVLRDTRKGDPDDPLTDAELREKFTELAEVELGTAAARDLADRLWAVGRLTDLRDAFSADPVPTP